MVFYVQVGKKSRPQLPRSRHLGRPEFRGLTYISLFEIENFIAIWSVNQTTVTLRL